MKTILSASQMASCDKYTSENYRIPSIVLMERAALSVKDFINETFSLNKSIGIVCGVGNNGGDGLCLVRLLSKCGFNVSYFIFGNKEKFSESAKLQYEILKSYCLEEEKSYVNILSCDVIVDSVFGTGLKRTLNNDAISLFKAINATNAIKISVDIPSGLNATTGQIMGECIKADYTVTFAYEKLGHYINKGKEYTGKLILKDIGIYDDSLPNEKFVKAYEKADLKDLLPKRTDISHKGTYGKVLVIAGKKDMAGACYFAAKAAYLSGCGLVKVYTEEANRDIIQKLIPEAMLTTYDKSFKENDLIDDLKWANSVVIGPGFGTSTDKINLFEFVLNNISSPLIIDADAISIVSTNTDILKKLNYPCVLTPHIGEMSRVTNIPINEINDNLIETASDFSLKYNVYCVLKSAATVITTPNDDDYLNIYGNNGMSTGGSGDVLSGIIAGILAQNNDLDTSLKAGVLLHSLAGDYAKEKKGCISLIADDILNSISDVLKTF